MTQKYADFSGKKNAVTGEVCGSSFLFSVLPSVKGHRPSAGFKCTSRGSSLGLMLIIIGTLMLFKVSFSKKIGKREAQSDVVSPLSNSQPVKCLSLQHWRNFPKAQNVWLLTLSDDFWTGNKPPGSWLMSAVMSCLTSDLTSAKDLNICGTVSSSISTILLGVGDDFERSLCNMMSESTSRAVKLK